MGRRRISDDFWVRWRRCRCRRVAARRLGARRRLLRLWSARHQLRRRRQFRRWFAGKRLEADDKVRRGSRSRGGCNSRRGRSRGGCGRSYRRRSRGGSRRWLRRRGWLGGRCRRRTGRCRRLGGVRRRLWRDLRNRRRLPSLHNPVTPADGEGEDGGDPQNDPAPSARRLRFGDRRGSQQCRRKRLRVDIDRQGGLRSGPPRMNDFVRVRRQRP